MENYLDMVSCYSIFALVSRLEVELEEEIVRIKRMIL